MNPSMESKLREHFEALPYELQRRVLDFAQALALSAPKGVPGKRLLAFAGAIPPDDVQEMARAIEVGCEVVDQDEW